MWAVLNRPIHSRPKLLHFLASSTDRQPKWYGQPWPHGYIHFRNFHRKRVLAWPFITIVYQLYRIFIPYYGRILGRIEKVMLRCWGPRQFKNYLIIIEAITDRSDFFEMYQCTGTERFYWVLDELASANEICSRNADPARAVENAPEHNEGRRTVVPLPFFQLVILRTNSG